MMQKLQRQEVDNISLAFPFITYGYVYDSNGDILEGSTVTLTGDSPVSDDTDSSGRYMTNLMAYASSGGTITVSANGLGETTTTSFKLVVSDPGKSLDLTLEEAIQTKDIHLNTYHSYGNELYIFTPSKKEGWCKTSDY